MMFTRSTGTAAFPMNKEKRGGERWREMERDGGREGKREGERERPGSRRWRWRGSEWE